MGTDGMNGRDVRKQSYKTVLNSYLFEFLLFLINL